MSVRQEGGMVFLEGRCGAEDAETLLVALQGTVEARIDASGLTRLHLALAQVLFAFRPEIVALPVDPAIAEIIFAPLISVRA